MRPRFGLVIGADGLLAGMAAYLAPIVPIACGYRRAVTAPWGETWHLPRARILVLAFALPALFLSAGCAGRLDPTRATAADWAGTPVPRPPAAPPLRLRDSTGRPFDLSAARGHPALVTFLYTRCPDVCPLIADRLRSALRELGPRADRVQLVAVSVDPRGDTPGRVRRFLAAHGLAGRMRYLLGRPAALRRVWRAWHVAASPSATRPPTTDHSSPVYGITASGRMATVYSGGPRARELVHDVPLLARR